MIFYRDRNYPYDIIFSMMEKNKRRRGRPPKYGSTTLREVAEIAECSTTTAWRAMNPEKDAAERMRAKPSALRAENAELRKQVMALLQEKIELLDTIRELRKVQPGSPGRSRG